jgi:hypothetical protein
LLYNRPNFFSVLPTGPNQPKSHFLFHKKETQVLKTSLRHALGKITWWHFERTPKEVIWPKKFLNYMHGLKSDILAMGWGGWGGCALLVQPTKMHHSI